MKALASLVLGSVLLAAGAAEAATYTADLSKSKLNFGFTQAGAKNTGAFDKYSVSFVFDAAALPAAKLTVTIQTASVNTGDKERDDTLRSEDLFSSAKFAQATFVSTSIVSDGADHYHAVGKLTLRDVTKDITVPFTFKPGTMTGALTLKRLDYGVGKGDWKSTDWVGDDVNVSFDLKLSGG